LARLSRLVPLVIFHAPSFPTSANDA
jgi:hypothetical protein